MEISNQYWAGFFDGEGNIQPQRYVSKVHGEKFIVAFKVVVSQKEPIILYMFQKKFGGYVRVTPVVTPSGFKTTRGVWECGRAEDVITFLQAIKPYVIVKSVEVTIALDILDGIIKSRENYNFKKIEGRSYLSGKMPIDLPEIKRRQILERQFFKDRQDSKGVEVEVKPIQGVDHV
jgi:hypothetical protein